MKNTFGNALALTIFGESHGPAVGAVLDGMAAGVPVDEAALAALMDRRRARGDGLSTARVEADEICILSGVAAGHTTGTPVTMLLRNTNTRSGDYAKTADLLRPGHADYPARVKYGNWHDIAGGGHFSGRLTAPLCIAGGIALQALALMGIEIVAHIATLGTEGIADESLNALTLDEAQVAALRTHAFPCISTDAATRMEQAILDAKAHCDSIGGIIECAAYGMPAGAGDPMFDGIENRIAQIAFGIPAVKGVDFGAGFAAAFLMGSDNNDPYRMEAGTVQPQSNNAGGVLGGITTGAPIIWQMAVKPTPSIGREQQTVDMDRGDDAVLTVRGRHDPCIVPRAVPVAEAACAIALLDALLDDNLFPAPAPNNMQ